MQYKMNDKLKFYENANNNSNTVTEIPFLSFFQNKNKTIEFDYTGHSQTIELLPGKYKIECYGAKGADVYFNNLVGKGGFGAYVSGEIELKTPTRIYIYIGETGKTGFSNLSRTYNGGGGTSISQEDDKVNSHGSGGGSTDIRLIGGDWSEEESLKSRIMVASGGGSASAISIRIDDSIIEGIIEGANGGQLYGNVGKVINQVESFKKMSWLMGNGGYKNDPGGYTEYDFSNRGSIIKNSSLYGAFGYGGLGTSDKYGYCASGAGSGYYGGTGSAYAGGGSGSSFISGHSGCDAIDINGIHTGKSIHYSGLYFTNTSMRSGDITDTNGQGKVIITFLEEDYSSILIEDNEKIKQVNSNSILTVLKNKNINNLEFKDFYYTDQGNEILREKLESDKIKILSIKDYFKYKILESKKFYTAISNKDILKIYDIFNVKKIKIEDVGQIKYLIYNGKNYYTWIDEELAIYGNHDKINTNPEYMYKIGMSSDIINNFTEEDWNKIFTKTASAKYIRFIAILEYNSNTVIKKIEMTKDAFPYNINLDVDSYDEIMYPEKDVITLKEQYNKIRILYSV